MSLAWKSRAVTRCSVIGKMRTFYTRCGKYGVTEIVTGKRSRKKYRPLERKYVAVLILPNGNERKIGEYRDIDSAKFDCELSMGE